MSEMPRYQCHICNCVVEAPTESPPICTGPRQYDPQVGGPVRHFRTIMDRVDNASSTGTWQGYTGTLTRQLEQIEARLNDLEEHLAHRDARLDGHTRRIGELERKVDYIADAHDKRLSGLEGRIDTILSSLTQRLSRLEERAEKLEQDGYAEGLQQQIDQLSQRISDQPTGTWQGLGYASMLQREVDRLAGQVDHHEKQASYNFETLEEFEKRLDGHTKRIGELERWRFYEGSKF